MRVASGQFFARLMAAGSLGLVLSCSNTTSNNSGSAVWITLFNNTSTVAVSVDIVSAYGTRTIPVLAGGTTTTSQVEGDDGDFLTFRVTAPGASGNVDCQVDAAITTQYSSSPAPSVFGQVNIQADGTTTTVTCGNNWK